MEDIVCRVLSQETLFQSKVHKTFSDFNSIFIEFYNKISLYNTGMHMGLGGNPYGPAGTGKTESVKAMGGLFGRQVLVFNCDEVKRAGTFMKLQSKTFAL